MTDVHIVAPAETGAYELALDAGEPREVDVEARPIGTTPPVTVINHSLSKPLYLRTDGEPSVRDPRAMIVPPGNARQVTLKATGTLKLWVVCEIASSFSVARL